MDQGDSPSETSVFFPPNPAIIYEDRLTSVKPGHLYVPKASNQASLDAFFKLGAFFYIFLFTVENNHDIKKRIEDSLPVNLLDVLDSRLRHRSVRHKSPVAPCSLRTRGICRLGSFLVLSLSYVLYETTFNLFSSSDYNSPDLLIFRVFRWSALQQSTS